MKTTVTASVERRFAQSAERVFDAFLDPQRAGRFLFATPSGQMVKVEIDPRVGGRFCFVERRGGDDIEHTGEYLEIERPRRLVFSFAVPRYSPDADRVSIEIVPIAGGGCLLTLRHEMSAEWAPVQRRAQRGWAQILDAAARVLSEQGGAQEGESSRALALVEGGYEWSFEQALPGAPERVFRALTDPAELQRWFAFRIEGRWQQGAELRFIEPTGELPPEGGAVTRFEPPSVLAYTWGEQAFQWELSPREGQGTQLMLTNTFPAAMKLERDSTACWQHCSGALQAQLTALAQYLEGQA